MAPPAELAATIDFLLGSADSVDTSPVAIFAPERVAFLARVSGALFADRTAARLPDVAAFAFWCRRASLDALATRQRREHLRVGLGAVFHIAPANVPINFAYSLAFSFLAGNTSIVRLPSRPSEAVDAVLRALALQLAEPQHTALRPAIHLLRYDHDDRITRYWLRNTLGRVIWGGDATIDHMRSLGAHPRSREIAFPDRYSFAAMSAAAIAAADAEKLAELAQKLASDVYLMDQRACSSPHLVAWIGGEADTDKARTLFWPVFEAHAKARYLPEPIHAMDRFVDTCRELIDADNIAGVSLNPPALTRIHLTHAAKDLSSQRGYYGTLHEATFASLAELSASVDPRCQTMTHIGFTEDELKAFVLGNRLAGLDRIVPVGGAHDMNAVWDGYDLIDAMSRIVDLKTTGA